MAIEDLQSELDAAMARLQDQLARQLYAVSPDAVPYVAPRRTVRERMRAFFGRFADAVRGARAGWRGERVGCDCEGSWG